MIFVDVHFSVVEMFVAELHPREARAWAEPHN